jgi:FKBP-type peptidyl-prolyl cis-trans isomerase FklB
MNRMLTLSLLLVVTSFSHLKAQNLMDTLSYSIGVVLAENLKTQGFEKFDVNVLAQAMGEYLNGESKISMDDAAEIFGEAMQQVQANKHIVNKEAGEAFLAENSKRKEVVTLPSGLQYQIIKPGNGPKPTASDKVNVHYHGTLITGEVFDSSVERGQPISFPLSGVIKGWTEGLQYMPVGSTYKLFIPYDLAYGSREAGPTIKPYSALVFEVQLLGIE